jgi:hypothetical protein
MELPWPFSESAAHPACRSFAQLIRQRREALGLSLYALQQPGPRLFHPEAIRLIELEKRVPNLELMLRVCWRLEMPFGATMLEVDRHWQSERR